MRFYVGDVVLLIRDVDLGEYQGSILRGQLGLVHIDNSNPMLWYEEGTMPVLLVGRLFPIDVPVVDCVKLDLDRGLVMELFR